MLCELRKSTSWKLFSTANYFVSSAIENPIKTYKDSLTMGVKTHAMWPQFWMAEIKLNGNMFAT